MDADEVLCEFQAVSFPTKSAIYVWGYNRSGQTARKCKESHLRIPKQLPPKLFKSSRGRSLRWIDVACGHEHTAAVASDGTLYTWGSNEFGQLGDGTEEIAKHPKKVKLLQTELVKSVSCGAHCTAVIAEPRENDGTISTGRLWVWGQNQGSNYPLMYWGAFTPNTIICQVSCGAAHAVALSKEGLLQAWGYNEYGQLGRGFTCEGLQRARVLNAYGKFLDEAPELVKIILMSCGEYHTAAISENSELYTWGLGSMGQLGHCSLQYGDKELIPRRVVALDGMMIKDVTCGGVHTCALTVEGALYAWGGGQAGQLGLGPQTSLFCSSNDSEMLLRTIPVLVIPSGVHLVTNGHSHTLVYMRDGRIYGWGYNNYGQAANEKSTYAWFPSPVDWCVGEVKRLAAGGGHSVVLTDACTLKELCEFRLAENVTISNSVLIEDVASRTGSDALARLCERLRTSLINYLRNNIFMADASAKRPLLSSLSNPQRQEQKKRFRRWKTAPSRDTSLGMGKNSTLNPESNPVFKSLLPSFRLVALLLVLYLVIGSTCFYLVRYQLVGKKTNGVLDSLYLCIVTMTTVGYGDLVPNSVASKLLACVFVFSGMAIVALFLSNAVDYLLEKQEVLLIKALEQQHLMHNASKKQMLKEMEANKVKYKLFMSTGALVILVIVGTLILSLVEKLGIIDAFYCVCSTVTTLGYGDKSFSTTSGRAFAVVWILISTICLAQCFVHLAELHAEQRQQSFVKWVLARRLTFGDLEAADLDDDDVVSGAEFVIYKLTEMGKIKQEDVELVMEQFEKVDVDQSGTISDSDLIQLHS